MKIQHSKDRQLLAKQLGKRLVAVKVTGIEWELLLTAEEEARITDLVLDIQKNQKLVKTCVGSDCQKRGECNAFEPEIECPLHGIR